MLLLNHAKELAQKIAQLERESIPKSASSKPVAKRFVSELKNYAWEQSEKFVKIFVTLDGVTLANKDAQLDCNFEEKALSLIIRNATKDRDYSFIVKNLLETIDTEKSYAKIKTDMVAIYLKKTSEGNSNPNF